MGFEDVAAILDFVSGFDDFEFIIYAKVDAARQHDNIVVKPLCHQGFHKDLEDCNGVISNAGFELASECLQLGKKLLIKPLLNQYEQLSNAVALQALDRASVIQSLDKQALAHWLTLPGNEPIDYPNVAQSIALWLQEQWQNTAQSPSKAGTILDPARLAKQLWQQCHRLPHLKPPQS